MFLKALEEVEAEYNSINITPIREPGFIEIYFEDKKKDLMLKYNIDMLKTLSVEEIEVLLLHEAYHVLTLPSTLIKIPDSGERAQQQLLVDYLEAFDEYICHLEFVNRFNKDERFNTFVQYQKSNFQNFDDIIQSLRITRASNPWKVFHFIYSIIYDAIFFLITKDDSFNYWCIENNMGALYTFSEWVYDDFKYIRNKGFSYDEERDYVIQSSVLSWSVNSLEILHNNRIIFANTTEKLHKGLIERGQVVKLAKAWEQRRVSTQEG